MTVMHTEPVLHAEPPPLSHTRPTPLPLSHPIYFHANLPPKHVARIDMKTESHVMQLLVVKGLI